MVLPAPDANALALRALDAAPRREVIRYDLRGAHSTKTLRDVAEYVADLAAVGIFVTCEFRAWKDGENMPRWLILTRAPEAPAPRSDATLDAYRLAMGAAEEDDA